MGEFHRGAAKDGVAHGFGAAGEVIRFRPSVKEGEWFADVELTRTLLLDETLMQEVFDDAGDEAGAGFGEVDEFALPPNAVTVSQPFMSQPSAMLMFSNRLGGRS